jgi:capsular polysaccharide transport system ATP-binding protein
LGLSFIGLIDLAFVGVAFGTHDAESSGKRMIKLENITHVYGTGAERKCALRDIDVVLDTNQSIGILGLNGSGKSTLLRIIAGTQQPTHGCVYRNCRISWPMGLGGFNGTLTGEENLRFVCRLYGADRRAVLRFVEDFTELGRDLYLPVRTYSSGMKSRLSLALSLAIHFDVYLIDEGLSVGDVRFQERYRQVIKNRFQGARVIIVSHHGATLRQHCTHAAVLHQTRMSPVLPLAEANRLYDRVIHSRHPKTAA